MFRFICVVSLVTGTMFLMWLGEQITERGLGNGISILIFAGIVAGLPSAIGGLFELVRTGGISPLSAIFIIALIVLVTDFVVFVERGQRKILVNYAKRQVGNKVYGGQSSYLPLKLNMSGVIPPIFASSIILLPATMVSWFTTGDATRWLNDSRGGAVARAADLRVAVCGADRVLLLLLHGAGLQQPRDRGQPEEERCLHSGHPPGRADRALHRQDPDAADAGRRDLHHVCLPAAGVPERSATCRSTSVARRC